MPALAKRTVCGGIIGDEPNSTFLIDKCFGRKDEVG
jgi:hypothetical protein